MGSKTYAPIARTQIARLQRDLDALVKRCEELSAGTETEADAYQYAYVRLCGLLEQSLLWVGRALVHRLATTEAQAFGLSYLDRSGRNPTEDFLVASVRRFNSEWAADLELWLAEDDRGGSINSLVGIRNGIAHGSSFGGSSRSFVNYYVVVYELIDWLLERFDPKP